MEENRLVLVKAPACAGMTERAVPPTARERALYGAATRGSPQEFVRLCGVIGRDPTQMLNSFDAEPRRWLIVSFAPSGYIADGARELRFPTEIRARLDAARHYVQTPRWRRLGPSLAPVNQPTARDRQLIQPSDSELVSRP